MSSLYTNVYQRGNFLYVRGIRDGQRFRERIDFKPTMWVSGKVKGATDVWHNLIGTPVYSIQPGSMYDCRSFTEQYADVHGLDLYESPGHAYQYIAETYKDEIVFNPNDISVFTIDIETETESGFPEPSIAGERILLITIKDTRSNKVYTWGLHPFDNDIDYVDYRYFSSEQSLLKDFISFWQHNYPDVITGWNTRFFDLPYLYNRICRVLDETTANKLSPWQQVREAEVQQFGLHDKSRKKVMIAGIADLDYLELYRKFTYSAQESYALDYIAGLELSENKLKNPGSTFKDFYTNHWDTFVRYNIRDVELVDRIDNKMKLIDLALTLAYAAKVNYEDVFSPVKTWDVIIYNYLNEQKIVIPPRKQESKSRAYEGAYVKDPLVGKHNWCVSFDLNSLYPMLMVQYNMSPDTIADLKLNVSVDGLLNQEHDLSVLVDKKLTMAASGQCFRTDKKGLMPTLAQHYYDQRVVSKKQMIGVKQRLEAIKAEKERRGLL